MAYLEPGWFTRTVANPLAGRLAMARGLAGTARLTVTGRRSGTPRAVPVIPVQVDGVDYLVSTRGESDWVRNVRAAGEVRLHRRGSSAQRLRASELPVEDRTPIIEAYRAAAGRLVTGYWESLPDAEDHPVFRLDPA